MASSLSPSLSAIFPTLSSKSNHHSYSLQLSFCSRKLPSLFIARSVDDVAGGSVTIVEKKLEDEVMATTTIGLEGERVEVKEGEKPLGLNEAAVAIEDVQAFKDSRWVGGTWDLVQFQKAGVTDWD